MYDTHAHLDILLEHQKGGFEIKDGEPRKQLEIRNADIAQLRDGIKNHSFLIQATVSTDNYTQVTKWFSELDNIYFLQGSHPEIVTPIFDVERYVERFDQILATKNSKRVGIGEVGLDYYYSQDPIIIAKQKQLFEDMIQRAITQELPLIIHCREAFDDLFEVMDHYPEIFGKFLIHCFTGTQHDLDRVLERKGLVAYGGIITFGKNADELRGTLQNCPIESFVLETDLPFLAPAPHRGKTCIPEYIDHVAQKAGDIKNLTKDQIWKQTEQTARLFFSIAQ
jgi:TatD DNase family protein